MVRVISSGADNSASEGNKAASTTAADSSTSKEASVGTKGTVKKSSGFSNLLNKAKDKAPKATPAATASTPAGSATSAPSATTPAATAAAKPAAAPKAPSAFSNKVKKTLAVAGDAKVDLDPQSVQLTLRRINPVSAAKVGFFVSLAIGIIIVILVTLFWLLLDTSGIIFQFSQAIVSSGVGGDISQSFSVGRVAIVAALLACFNVVLSTILAAIFAGIYNAAATISGGLKMRFTNNS